MRRLVFAPCLAVCAFYGGSTFAASDNRIDIQAVVTGTYDSNVARSSEQAATARGVTPQDWITEPAVTVDILVPVSRQAVFLKGSAGYDFYANNHILNSGRVDLDGGLQFKVARCSGTAAGDYLYQQSDLQYLATLAATKNTENDKTIRFDGSCGGDLGIAPSLSVSQRWSDNSNPGLVTSNYTELNVTGGLGYRKPRFGDLSVYFSYDQTGFPNRNEFVGPGYKDYSTGVSYDRRFGAKIQGTVKVGYTWVRPDAPTVPGTQGVTFDGELTFRASSLLQAKLSFERCVSPTILPEISYSVSSTYGLEGDYTPGRKLRFVAGATGGRSANVGLPIFVNTQISSESTWAIYGSAHYQLNRRIGLELDARHEAADANLPEFSYSDNRIGLSISAAI